MLVLLPAIASRDYSWEYCECAVNLGFIFHSLGTPRHA